MFASYMVWLGFFPTSFATTGNWTHFSSVAPHLSVLNPGCFTDRATAAAASLRHRGPGKNKQLMLELILFSPSIFRLAHHETEINSVPFVDVSPVLLIFYRSCKKLVGKNLFWSEPIVAAKLYQIYWTSTKSSDRIIFCCATFFILMRSKKEFWAISSLVHISRLWRNSDVTAYVGSH